MKLNETITNKGLLEKLMSFNAQELYLLARLLKPYIDDIPNCGCGKK